MAQDFITREAGAVLNKRNRNALQLAFDTIVGVLEDAGVIPPKEDSASDETKSDDPPTNKSTKTKQKESRQMLLEASGGFSLTDLSNVLQNAVNDLRPEMPNGEYVSPYRVIDIFPDESYCVYCVGWSGTECYRVDYTVAEDGTVTLSTPLFVSRKTTYVLPAISDLTANEAGAYQIEETFTRLVEAAVTADGTTLIKLIAPGLGSSGLYTADVLQRDGARAFPKGTKMFWDHDTPAEEAARPEGTLTRFAAVLDEDARYLTEHKAGAGLYARATVFEDYRAPLNEKATHIGTSIRADGQYKMGDFNGARVPVITAIKPWNGINNRVDFVTAPGAGGAVLALFESVRNRQGLPEQNTMEANTMTDEQIAAAVAKGIKEAMAPLETQVARLREASMLREARAFADQTLAGAKYGTLPKPTRERIASTVSLSVPLTESGTIDATKLSALIEAAAQEEATYLTSATGRTIAIGLGESRAPNDASPTNDADQADPYEAEAAQIFANWGLGESAAKIAAAGRT